MAREGIPASLIERMDALGASRLLIAVDGRCAAGKSTLAGRLAEYYDANVFPMDAFFLRPVQRTAERLAAPGGNVDYERFEAEVLRPLLRGVPFSYAPYVCSERSLGTPVQVEPRRVNIIEGSYALHPKLWGYYDLRVTLWLDAQEQLRRIAERNGEAALQRFKDDWIPMEENYFSAYRIRERCDVRYRTDKSFEWSEDV